MKYYTVKEAMEILGISDKAIYKSLDDGKLKNYKKIYKGKKLISEDGLLLEYKVEEKVLLSTYKDLGIELNQGPSKNKNGQVEIDIENIEPKGENSTYFQLVIQTFQANEENLKEQIKGLQKELAQKDKIIEGLQKTIEREQDITEKIQEKLGQEQELQLHLQKLIEKEQILIEEQPKKKGFFSRRKKQD